MTPSRLWHALLYRPFPQRASLSMMDSAVAPSSSSAGCLFGKLYLTCGDLRKASDHTTCGRVSISLPWPSGSPGSVACANRTAYHSSATRAFRSFQSRSSSPRSRRSGQGSAPAELSRRASAVFTDGLLRVLIHGRACHQRYLLSHGIVIVTAPFSQAIVC